MPSSIWSLLIENRGTQLPESSSFLCSWVRWLLSQWLPQQDLVTCDKQADSQPVLTQTVLTITQEQTHPGLFFFYPQAVSSRKIIWRGSTDNSSGSKSHCKKPISQTIVQCNREGTGAREEIVNVDNYFILALPKATLLTFYGPWHKCTFVDIFYYISEFLWYYREEQGSPVTRRDPLEQYYPK